MKDLQYYNSVMLAYLYGASLSHPKEISYVL